MALALRQITAHEAAVGFLNTVVQGQDLLAEGDGGGILALLAIVFTQSIGNIQVSCSQPLSLRARPIIVEILFQKSP